MTDILLGILSSSHVIVGLLGILVLLTFGCVKELKEIECNLEKIAREMGDNKWNKS